MMDKKRVRKTLSDIVDAWCIDRASLGIGRSWIRGQISFACMADAITAHEQEDF